MKLRARLILTTLVAAILAFATIGVLHRLFWMRAANEVGREFALAYMENGGRAACEAAPERFGFARMDPGGGPDEPRRPPDFAGRHGPDEPSRATAEKRPEMIPWPFLKHRQLFAYDAKLLSKNPQSPKPAAELRDALATGASYAGRRFKAQGPHFPPGERPGPGGNQDPAWREGNHPPPPQAPSGPFRGGPPCPAARNASSDVQAGGLVRLFCRARAVCRFHRFHSIRGC